MKYCKVKENGKVAYENKCHIYWHLLKNELYTEKEIKRLKLKEPMKWVNYKTGEHVKVKTEDLFQKVEISNRKVYWMFGARFESTIES